MKKLILRGFILLLPFIVLVGYFFIKDPMKIVPKKNGVPTTPGVLMNDRLYVGRHISDNVHAYNSYILGSSRSKAFKIDAWNEFVDSKAYHLGVNDETLYGLERKLNYIDSLGGELNHVLIQLDHRLLSLSQDHSAHIFREYYEMTNESRASYYQRFFNAFLKPSFLKEYYNYQNTGVVPENSSFLWDPGFTFDVETGDINYTRYDDAILKDSLNFYAHHASEFHERDPKVSDTLIDKKARKLLMKIKTIFDSNKTKYEIIVSPNYDQISLNKHDLKALNDIFGQPKVHNYSGVNNFTEEVGHYYEHKHFKPFIANQLMTLVYE